MRGPTYAHWLEQTEADVPAGDQWLSPAERLYLAGFSFEKRRSEWRLGRWTAKRAAAWCLNLGVDNRSLEDIEIRPLPSGAPQLFLFEQRAGVSVSLSHRGGHALCVVGLSGATLGCDLELVEVRDPSFVADFFTANERQFLRRAPADEREQLATVVWSAKESALKALQVGLRLSTTCVEVCFPERACPWREYSGQDGRVVWSPLSLQCADRLMLSGWWRCAKNVVRTVVFNRAQAGAGCDRDSRWLCQILQA